MTLLKISNLTLGRSRSALIVHFHIRHLIIYV